jgi:hypothetical protein
MLNCGQIHAILASLDKTYNSHDAYWTSSKYSNSEAVSEIIDRDTVVVFECSEIQRLKSQGCKVVLI